MELEVKVPSVGESVKEAVLAQWFKADGDAVKKDEPLFVIETDKVTLEVAAPADGVLKILVQEEETVAIGAVVAVVVTDAAGKADDERPPEAADSAERVAADDSDATEKPAPSSPAQAGGEAAAPAQPSSGKADAGRQPTDAAPAAGAEGPRLSPSVRRLVAEKGLDTARIPATGPGGRLTKMDVLLFMEQSGGGILPAPPGEGAPKETPPPAPDEKGGATRRKAMSPIRRRIAARLLEAKQQTAMLTTFNDIDMSRAMAMRAEYKEAFKKRHGVGLGFMSFFIKASVAALKEFPAINAFIEGDDIVYHDYCHIGVAVGSERGLVVPVIRHAERLSFAQVEQAIVDFVAKIKDNRLELADLEGGTFTVTNGGVFGSLLSTPILNTPQSGILGMHRIDRRPMAVGDEVVVRPMMYVALSYDHRIVDGREAVTCLRRIKEFVENPERMMMEI